MGITFLHYGHGVKVHSHLYHLPSLWMTGQSCSLNFTIYYFRKYIYSLNGSYNLLKIAYKDKHIHLKKTKTKQEKTKTSLLFKLFKVPTSIEIQSQNISWLH